MFIKVLKQLKQINPKHEQIVFFSSGSYIVSGIRNGYFDRFIHNQIYDCITYLEFGHEIPYYRYTNEVMDFFINHKIYDIQFDNNTRVPCFSVKQYSPKDLACLKILRYYRKYRYNLFRKRLDPLKKELMEYCWHPCRFREELF